MHVARVAEKLKVSSIIIPTNASVGSAVGFLKAPVGYEVVKSLRTLLKAFPVKKVNDLLEIMREEAEKVIGNKLEKNNFTFEKVKHKMQNKQLSDLLYTLFPTFDLY